MNPIWRVVACLIAIVLHCSPTYGAEKRAVDFLAEIQPILASRCIACHGPKKQHGGLRLDAGPAALAGGDSGVVIVPGKPAESYLLRRAASRDTAERMPPMGEPLTEDQIAVLTRWIADGAKWPADSQPGATHWSLRPAARPAIPAEARGARNPIDCFVIEKLAAHRLQLSAEADRRTLMRRLSFDLVGLPPTPEETDTFIADQDPKAYEKLVERLLVSPRHGERWAQHWLDAVRFAESDGFETNKPRTGAWPYRDYVIESFNADKPYDRFVLEQLAGDVLGVDAATGFLVGGANDVVTSPDPVLTVQQRADVLHDMVSTTGSALLGLTVGCARCHNHKFDPISQADYYAMKAVFAGVRHGERSLKNAESDERQAELAMLSQRLLEIDGKLLRWEPLAEPVSPFAPRKDVLSRSERRQPVHPRLNVERFAPVTAKRLRMTIQRTNGAEPCIDELEVFTAGEQPRNIALASAGTTARASSVYPNSALHKLEHINDGRIGNSRSWISAEQGRGWVELEFAEPARIDTVRWGRDREEKYADRLPLEYTLETAEGADDWRIVATAVDRESFVPGRKFMPGVQPDKLSKAEQEEFHKLAQERTSIDEQIRRLSAATMIYAGVFTASPPVTQRFHRGDPVQPREPVSPGALRAIEVGFSLEPVTTDAPVKLSEDQQRRLALARWIVDRANPLTARVIVNRIWQHHFGEGLVSTPSDFGANGAKPSHPELLDWLAMELVESGWSLRHIHRLIVNSATYRQASLALPEGLAADAQSRILWRYPSRRLEAESLRDAILAVSGKLDLKMGGPGFLAFEPNDNYVRVYNPKQRFDSGDWRRMIYMTKIRMQQDGTFGAFDCPDGGQIAPRRSQSTTPLQALNLLNSPFVIQQAEFLTQRIEKQAGPAAEAQVRRAFQLVFQREPAADEQAAALHVVRDHGLTILCRALFNSNEFLYVF